MLIRPVCFESSNDVQVERGHSFPAIWDRLPFLDVFFLLGIKENGAMGCWSPLCANSSLIRRSSLLGGKLLVKE